MSSDEVISFHNFFFELAELVGNFFDSLFKFKQKGGPGFLKGIELFLEVSGVIGVLVFQCFDIVLERTGDVAHMLIISAHGADQRFLGTLWIEADEV